MPTSSEPHPALGIDFGNARIGVAATDEFGILAHPVETVLQSPAAIQRISEIVSQRRIRTLVLGLPLRMDGSEGDSARNVRCFGNALSSAIPHLPLIYVDETLTTAAASQKLREAGKKAKQQKSLIDQAAAVEILNTWMETLSFPPMD